MKVKFSNRKVKITIENCFFNDLGRPGVLILVWNKTGLWLRSSAISSDEFYEDVQTVLKILTYSIKCPQAKRWFKKEITREV